MRTRPRLTLFCETCTRPFEGTANARFCREHRYRNLFTGSQLEKYPWRPEMDALLVDHYERRVKGRAGILARKFGYPFYVVAWRAAKLGVTAHRRNERWLKEEVEFLHAHAGERTAAWLAKKLRRPIGTIVSKVRGLSLSLRVREGYTLTGLVECFGVNAPTVSRWIDKGLLTGERRYGEDSSYAWHFTERQVLSFIRNHPTAFELRRVDQTWFLGLVMGSVRDGIRAATERCSWCTRQIDHEQWFRCEICAVEELCRECYFNHPHRAMCADRPRAEEAGMPSEKAKVLLEGAQ